MTFSNHINYQQLNNIGINNDDDEDKAHDSEFKMNFHKF